MYREIYTREESDEKYDASTLEYTDHVETIIQKIKMILGTSKMDVLGEPEMGIGIEDYIFKKSFSAEEIKKKIKNQLDLYIDEYPNYNIDVDVKFGKQTTGQDYALIDIYINKQKISGIVVS